MVDGTVSVGVTELVGVTEDSVGLDTVETLARGGKLTEESGREGPGIEGEDGVDRLRGSGVETEGTCGSCGGDIRESGLDGVTLDTTDEGRGMFSADLSSSYSGTTDGIVGMLETLGAGLLTQ